MPNSLHVLTLGRSLDCPDDGIGWLNMVTVKNGSYTTLRSPG